MSVFVQSGDTRMAAFRHCVALQLKQGEIAKKDTYLFST